MTRCLIAKILAVGCQNPKFLQTLSNSPVCAKGGGRCFSIYCFSFCFRALTCKTTVKIFQSTCLSATNRAEYFMIYHCDSNINVLFVCKWPEDYHTNLGLGLGIHHSDLTNWHTIFTKDCKETKNVYSRVWLYQVNVQYYYYCKLQNERELSSALVVMDAFICCYYTSGVLSISLHPLLHWASIDGAPVVVPVII